MHRQRVLVISQRSSLKTAVGSLLRARPNGRFRHESSLLEYLDSPFEPPYLMILDVANLLAMEPTLVPRLAPPAPRVIVVGFRTDSDLLVSAWREGIPAWAIEDLRAETLAQMTSQADGAFGIYEYLGRHTAERVHGFLVRRMVSRVLTAQEVATVELLCSGFSNARIARHLGLEEKTVKNRLTQVYEKLGVSSRYDLLARYLEAPASSHRSMPSLRQVLQ